MQDDADEFDAMIASVETKKISLTPSRLKTFEVSLSARPMANADLGSLKAGERCQIARQT